jgi:hypothetical protein
MEIEGFVIEIDENDLGERDNYLQQIENQIQNKRDFLLNRSHYLEKIKKENQFLEGVRNNYANYYSTILKQKEEQIQSMNMLNQYLSEMVLNSKTRETEIQNTKKEQKYILKEMDRIQRELDGIIKVNQSILTI